MEYNKGGENMTNDEMLKAILDGMQGIRDDVQGLKEDVQNLKKDVEILKITAMKVEHELIPNVQALLENHADIAKKVDTSNDLQQEVKLLRFEMNLVKKQLETFVS